VRGFRYKKMITRLYLIVQLSHTVMCYKFSGKLRCYATLPFIVTVIVYVHYIFLDNGTIMFTIYVREPSQGELICIFLEDIRTPFLLICIVFLCSYPCQKKRIYIEI
jgi:hypothetical protein